METQQRKSNYSDFDESFVYDPSASYTVDDFSKLSKHRIVETAVRLNIRNAKNTAKNVLIDALVTKHVSNQVQKTQNFENEERKDTDESVVQSSNITADAVAFSEQFKESFRRVRHYKYGDDV